MLHIIIDKNYDTDPELSDDGELYIDVDINADTETDNKYILPKDMTTASYEITPKHQSKSFNMSYIGQLVMCLILTGICIGFIINGIVILTGDSPIYLKSKCTIVQDSIFNPNCTYHIINSNLYTTNSICPKKQFINQTLQCFWLNTTNKIVLELASNHGVDYLLGGIFGLILMMIFLALLQSKY